MNDALRVAEEQVEGIALPEIPEIPEGRLIRRFAITPNRLRLEWTEQTRKLIAHKAYENGEAGHGPRPPGSP